MSSTCVPAGAIHNGVVITMETLQFPVDIAHPADIPLDVLSHGPLLLADRADRTAVDSLRQVPSNRLQQLHIYRSAYALILFSLKAPFLSFLFAMLNVSTPIAQLIVADAVFFKTGQDIVHCCLRNVIQRFFRQERLMGSHNDIRH